MAHGRAELMRDDLALIPLAHAVRSANELVERDKERRDPFDASELVTKLSAQLCHPAW
jgi:hypothetical protein